MRRISFGFAASFLLRLAVAGVFVDAAVGKMRDAAAFAEQIANYHLFPELASYIATALPSTELVAAVAILLGTRTWRHAAMLVLLAMLGIFTVAIAQAWARGLDLECGCFGVGSTRVGPWPILRNLTLASALVTAFLLERRKTAG